MARPRGSESRRREREFLRLLGATGSFRSAVAGSRIDPRRLPVLLDQPAYWAAVEALKRGEVSAIAVASG